MVDDWMLEKTMDKPLVSVIIPTFNAGRSVARCLDSISAQSYKRLEVIIVDNNSTDDSLHDLAAKRVRVAEWPSKRAGARNRGACLAEGRFLFHVDADMELTQRVVEECIDCCLGQSADAVIVPEVSSGRSYWARCEGLEKTIAEGVAGHEAARFYRRSAFDEIGGYDPELEAGEDFDLQYRAEDHGLKVCRIKSTIVHHLDDASFSDIVRKSQYYGRTVNKYREKHRDRLSRSPPYLALLAGRWRVLAMDPPHAVGFFALVLIKYVAQK
jgi:glycosyltransferase involved in cell wall biosynthesis